MVNMLKVVMRDVGHHLWRRILRYGMDVVRCRRGIIFVVVIVITFAVEVFWAFVFMRWTELYKSQVRSRMGPDAGGAKEATNILVSCEGFSHITRRKFI
jgi:hypothetical protein